MLSRRTLLAAGVVLAGLAISPTAFAQTYPDKSVDIVVHTGAGGPLDTLARTMAEILTSELGWSVRVENRTGGNGEVALAHVLLQPADGYTIQAITSAIPNNFALGRSTASVDDVEYVTTLSGEQSVLMVRADSPLKSVEDYANALKADPAGLRIGGSGQGGNDFAHFLLDTSLGLTSPWIPFDAAPDVVVALLGGHLDAAYLTPSTALGQIQSGELRMLASSGTARLAAYPDVPTFKELGYDAELVLWRGIIVKAGTPPEVTAAISDAMAKVKASATWQAMMQSQQQEQFDVSGAEFKTLMTDTVDQLATFYKASGLIQ